MEAGKRRIDSRAPLSNAGSVDDKEHEVPTLHGLGDPSVTPTALDRIHHWIGLDILTPFATEAVRSIELPERMDHSLEDRDSPVADDRMEAPRRRTAGLSDASAVAPATRTPCDDQAHRYRMERYDGRTDGSAGAHPSRRRRRSDRTTSGGAAGPSGMGLALLVCHLLAPPRATAAGGRALQRYEKCSCSPREFGFRLSLSSACPALPPPFPPNSSFGAGVKDYTCSIAPEPIQERGPAGSLSKEDKIAQIQKEAELAQSEASGVIGGERTVHSSRAWRLNFEGAPGGTRRRRAQDTAYDYFPELFKVDESEWSSESFQTAAFTTTDMVPSRIFSVQFLEVDRAFNVINQDSTYVRDQDLVDGDVIRYESVSGRDPAAVPGGLNMVLRGETSAGELVRNVFTITYTNDCDVYTFEDGEAIGWVEFVSSLFPRSCETKTPYSNSSSLCPISRST